MKLNGQYESSFFVIVKLIITYSFWAGLEKFHLEREIFLGIEEGCDCICTQVDAVPTSSLLFLIDGISEDLSRKS